MDCGGAASQQRGCSSCGGCLRGLWQLCSGGSRQCRRCSDRGRRFGDEAGRDGPPRGAVMEECDAGGAAPVRASTSVYERQGPAGSGQAYIEEQGVGRRAVRAGEHGSRCHNQPQR